jgi:2-amino-4-hydroxy-6-hydroxymethyldihydropteridine diphosphokinase
VFKRIPWKTGWAKTVPPAARGNVVYIGLGTNIGAEGQKRHAVLRAVMKLDRLPTTQVIAVSSLYETPAWGVTDQPDFFNAVAAVQTAIAPLALLNHLKAIEHQLGRKQRRRWGPREIDMDLLVYKKRRVDLPGLTIPHKHMRERQFVLVPLREVSGRPPVR